MLALNLSWHEWRINALFRHGELEVSKQRDLVLLVLLSGSRTPLVTQTAVNDLDLRLVRDLFCLGTTLIEHCAELAQS